MLMPLVKKPANSHLKYRAVGYLFSLRCLRSLPRTPTPESSLPPVSIIRLALLANSYTPRLSGSFKTFSLVNFDHRLRIGILLIAEGLIVGKQVRFFVQSGTTIPIGMYVYMRASITLNTRQFIMMRQSLFKAFRFTYIYSFPIARRGFSSKDIVSWHIVPISANWIDLIYIFLSRPTYPFTRASHIKPSSRNYTILAGGVNHNRAVPEDSAPFDTLFNS